jgi:acetate---CoA ligase (ADP-forming)
LRDGSVARLRQAQAEDVRIIDEFLKSLSDESISFRFFDSAVERRILLQELVPSSSNYVLIAIRDGIVIGHSAYYKSGKNTAEIGIIILDAYQGKGLGTMMLEKIASAANRNGISIFETIIGDDNTRMIKMVKDMGFPVSVRVEQDVVRIRFPTSIDPITIELFKRL